MRLMRADDLFLEARAEYDARVAKRQKPRTLDKPRQRELAAREREGLSKLGIEYE